MSGNSDTSADRLALVAATKDDTATEKRKISASVAMSELRSLLSRADALAKALDYGLTEKAMARLAKSEADARRAREDASDLANRLVEVEKHAERLMNLYVATYQLHSTLEPADVQATIAEISITLLGAERFALLLNNSSNVWAVACEEGLDEDASGHYAAGQYAGGDPLVDKAMAQGQLQIAGPDAEGAVAVIPLQVQGEVVGALVVLKLLDHRAALGDDDRDLMDLLSAHAASALLAAQAYSEAHRKLRTLEGLVGLARARSVRQ